MPRRKVSSKVRNDGRAISQVERDEGRLRRMLNERERAAEHRRRVATMEEDADFGPLLAALHTGSRLPGALPGAPGSITLEVNDSGYIVCDSTGAAVCCTAPQPYFTWCTEGTPGGSATISIGNPIVPGDVNKRSERFLSLVQSFGGTVRTLRKAFTVSVPENYTTVKGMLTIAYLGNTQPVQQTQESLSTRPGAKSFPLASLIERPVVCHGVFGESSTFEGMNTTGGDTFIEQFQFSPDTFFENATPLYPATDSVVDAAHLASPHWYIAVGGANASAPVYVTCRTTYQIIPQAGISLATDDLRVSSLADTRSAALTLGELGPFPEPMEDVVSMGGDADFGDDSSDDDDIEQAFAAAPSKELAKAKRAAVRRMVRAQRPAPVVNYRRKPAGLKDVGNGLIEKYYGLGKHPDGWWETMLQNSGTGIKKVWNTLFDIAELGESAAADPEVQSVAQKAAYALELA